MTAIPVSGWAWQATHPPFVSILTLASRSKGRLRSTVAAGGRTCAATGVTSVRFAGGVSGRSFSAASTDGCWNFLAQSTAVSSAFDRIDVLAPASSSRRMMRGSGRSVAMAIISGVMPRMSIASTAASAASNRSTTAGFPLNTAKCSAVTRPNWIGPFLTVAAESALTVSGSAPRPSSVRTISRLPLVAAAISGVPAWPVTGGVETSAPLARSSVTTSASLTRAAAVSGVMPTLSATLTLAPLANSSRTDSAVPLAEAATRSGVRPICDTAFTSALDSSSRRTFAALAAPQCSAVTPLPLAARASAPLASSNRTASGLPKAEASISGV